MRKEHTAKCRTSCPARTKTTKVLGHFCSLKNWHLNMEFQPSRGNNNNNVPGHFWAICLRIASPVPLPFPACYHSIVPTGVVVKQIPARLQSQHCKQFDQTLYGCTCKKEIENSPFPAPYQALSVVVPSRSPGRHIHASVEVFPIWLSI